MWNSDTNFPGRGFSTPPATWKSRPSLSPRMPMSERKRSSPAASRGDLFHVIHKVPAGDSPYVKAKQVQLIEKDPNRAICLFWAAINSGDRVDSALKDMAIVMKQLNRSDEAIEAIKSFRHLCPYDTQESIDNVLVELYKRSGRTEEEIELLQQKLKHIEEGTAFGGRRTKTARSQGKKVQITLQKERSRILGNLAWAYMQQNKFGVAEEHYRKALSLELDKNKQCNLAICLMLMNRITEAKSLLQAVRASSGGKPMDESYAKSFERAFQMLTEIESQSSLELTEQVRGGFEQNGRPFISPPIGEFSNDINRYRPSELTVPRQWGENKDNMFGNNDGKFQYIPSSVGPRNNSHFALQTVSADLWNNNSYCENSGERRPGFTNSVKDVSSSCNTTYSSPSPVRRNMEVLFTQPRRTSWGFNNGQHLRREPWRENVTRSSNKKLSFDEHLPIIALENVQAQTDQKYGVRNLNSSSYKTTTYSSTPAPAKSTMEVPFTQPRKCPWGFNANDQNTERWKDEMTRKSNTGYSFESAFQNVKEERVVKDGSSKLDSKKSWADIAEEEEEEEDFFSGKPNPEFPDGWSSDEPVFNNENMNSNILNRSPHSRNHQVEDETRMKFESLDLKDGVSPRNHTVRRSLCFDQEKPAGYDNNNKNASQGNERNSKSGQNVKLLRRNRLQVFQDITVNQGSP